MDCEGCDSLHHIPGRTWGDPDSCFPPEDICRKDAPDNGPCDRMLGAIHDCINDSEFVTAYGTINTAELLTSEAGKEVLDECNIPEGKFDFSSASYWWLPVMYDPSDTSTEPVPYKDEAEVYEEWFE
jgi:hypothetical protein